MSLGVQRWRIAAWILVAHLGAASATPGQEDPGDLDEPPVEIHGFAEAAGASRFVGNPVQSDDLVLAEARFRLDMSHFADGAEFAFKGDFAADALTDDVAIDIRQAVITMRVSEWLDLRAGRQVLTWGTGDFVFLNDLFPKDFVSFFVGRDDEFLKAPSNSVKFSFYTGPANLDLVWTPVFEPDRFITGERLSFFDPSARAIVSATTMGGPLESALPARTLRNGELAGRAHRTVGGYELSLYGYAGFTKQPEAFDSALDMSTHSRLYVYGASGRGNVAGGIGNVEGAYYDSADDAGSDPDVPNSQIRGLVGYEHELLADLTLGLQYYVEWTLDYDALIAGSPTPEFEPDEARHTFTVRTTYRLRQQTVILSLFSFVSPSDKDTHIRPSVSYDWSDAASLVLGANIMAGDDAGFFGQLEENTNAYFRLRYSF